MNEQAGVRHPSGPQDPAVEAVRAFRDEDIVRSAAKWDRIEATWGETAAEDVKAAPQDDAAPSLDWDF